jgi:hypothetical protein
MGKIIFWIVVVFAVLFALRVVNSSKLRSTRKGTDSTGRASGPAATPMIQCVDCGVFLPAPDATTATNGYRCGDPACPNRKRASH